MKPVVGITSWRRTLDTFYGPDRLQTLSTFYSDSVEAAGMIPVLFPAGMSPEDAGKLVGSVDGILLSGGDDVDPATYGEDNTASKNVDPAADAFEIAIIEAARSQGKPLLGICRGLQIFNVAHSGTLAQEVTADDTTHEPFVKGTDPEVWNARRHVVAFEEGSILADMYGADEAKVNTLHHQGVGQLGDDLIIEARAEDGLIEAVRYDGDWWALAVQWHPERLDGDHQELFRVFRDAILNPSTSS